MKISSISKHYPIAGRKLEVLKDLSLDLGDREITVILGRSGCGKTTLLRLIAGLEPADSGAVEFDGKTGMIFQEPRLMPWLTVTDNILFGLPFSERRKRTEHPKLRHLIELTGLSGFETAYPAQLSGGMQQRAGLARALAYDPDYLLMDEPFAALDHFTRQQMQQELISIHKTEQKGILFVTHSIDEALTIGKKIIILENGGCKTEYLLRQEYPRNLLDEELVELKKEIIERIGVEERR